MADSVSVEDRLAIYELIASYSWAMDTGNEELLLSVYAADGTFTGGSGSSRGHAELREQVREHARTRAGSQHVTSNVVVAADGDEFTARCYCVIVRSKEQPYVSVRGEYHDRIVRRDGHLVFSSREFRAWD